MIAQCQFARASINVESLAKKIGSKAHSASGTLGVGVYDFETGQSWYWNGDKSFPMMSVAKMVVTIAVLQMVDQGKLSIDGHVAVSAKDVAAIRSGVIPDPLKVGTRFVTLHSLMQKAICNSNNGAVDVLMRLAGGPQSVDKSLASLNVPGIRVDRYEGDIVKAESKKAADTSNMDTATPKGMCDMLVKLQKVKLLSSASTNVLLSMMAECKTGDYRIKAGFPSGTVVQHKTGTGGTHNGLCSATNDVAIVALPSGKKLAVAIFLANAGGSDQSRDKVIASVSSDIYDAVEKH